MSNQRGFSHYLISAPRAAERVLAGESGRSYTVKVLMYGCNKYSARNLHCSMISAPCVTAAQKQVSPSSVSLRGSILMFYTDMLGQSASLCLFAVA